jgi:hypothetical protein
MKIDWRISKSSNPKFGGPWQIETRVWFEENGQLTIGENWTRHSAAATRKAAIARAMLLRQRGERISWPGGAVRMGIALVDPCPID